MRSWTRNAGLMLALTSGAALAQTSTGWKATFPVEHKGIPPESAGVYTGGAVPLNLDSLGANMMVPNTSGYWKVVPNAKDPGRGEMSFYDPVIGLRLRGPNEPPERLDGTLSAMATVNQVFAATKAVVTVNTTGGYKGQGAVSRQGPMIRWNGSTQFLVCYVDFSAGTTYLWAGRSAVVYIPLGKAVPIQGFSRTKPYRVEFTMVDQVARCQVYDGDQLVADTGNVKDDKTPAKGAVGVLIEITAHQPEQALEGSFTQLSATVP